MGGLGSALASVWTSATGSEQVTLVVAAMTVGFATFVSILEFIQWTTSMIWGSKELRIIEIELERVWTFVNTK